MTEALNWYGEDVATFGDRLEAARRNANLSQRELAKHIGIKNSTLRNWEDDAEVVAALQKHAMEVSELADRGMAAVHEQMMAQHHGN